MKDDPLAANVVSAAGSAGGNAADSEELAASADWLSAAVVSSSKGSSKADSAKASAICGGAPAPEGWLATSIASGKLGNLGDDDETRKVALDSPKDTATQTDDVTITEATTVEETSDKPKSKLPPWAKPWTPPTPAAAVDAHPTLSSSTEKDDNEASSADRDSSNTGGHSSGGSGGLDWINATVTGEEERGAPTVESIVVSGGTGRSSEAVFLDLKSP